MIKLVIDHLEKGFPFNAKSMSDIFHWLPDPKNMSLNIFYLFELRVIPPSNPKS